MATISLATTLVLVFVTISCAKKTTARVKISFLEFSDAVTSNNYSPTTFSQYQLFVAQLPHGHVKTKEEAAMILAQILYQTRGLKEKREVDCIKTNCPTRYRNSDCDHPGQYYYGRGYIHLKGCLNYKKASEELFGDHRLVSQPDLVATHEAIAWATAFWFWRKNVHHNGGRSGKFGATTKAISPEECQGVHSSAKKRFDVYGNVRSAFGLRGPGSSGGCQKSSIPRIGK